MHTESQSSVSAADGPAEGSPAAAEPRPAEDDVFASLSDGDTRELARLVRDHVLALDGDEDARRLRAAFVTHRYAWELRAWKRRWQRYWKGFMLTTLCTSGLGVATSGIVAATSGHARSWPVNLVLIVIGALVAVLSAVNQLIEPRTAAMEYRRDQFALREVGWRYLGRLEEGADPARAYAEFRAAAEEILSRRHSGLLPGWTDVGDRARAGNSGGPGAHTLSDSPSQVAGVRRA